MTKEADSEMLLDMRRYAAAAVSGRNENMDASSASGTRAIAAVPRGTELRYTVAELNILELAARIDKAAKRILQG